MKNWIFESFNGEDKCAEIRRWYDKAFTTLQKERKNTLSLGMINS